MTARAAGIEIDAPVAVVGGRLLTGLRDVTTDVGALDATGMWAVVVPFAGPPVCARFERSRPARPWPGPPWQGPPPASWTSSLDRAGYEAGVQSVRSAIAAGDVYQVNLCRVLAAPLPDHGRALAVDIGALGAALAEGNPAPYSAMVRLPAHGVHVASASPERYLHRLGDMVESRPVKGTAATAGGFLAKDRAENVMIVDLVRNDLGRVCEWGTVEVPALCETEAHPGLHHLVSTVRGRLRPGVGWAELLAATFPPGSVTGAPKLAALDAIARLEPVDRGPYCGAVGWVDADRRAGDLNVAIRTFWVDDGGFGEGTPAASRGGDGEPELRFGTGAAVTWDSTPDGEWEETELKARRLIGLASGAVPVGAGS